MNRLAIVAATSVLALMLTACGEDKSSKPEEVKTETTVVQPSNEVKPADDANSTTTTTVTTPDAEQKSTTTTTEEKSN